MKLTGIRRHPVKGIGWESLESAALEPERPLAGDRAWAVAHEGCRDMSGAWRPRREFLVVASGPGLAAITAAADGDVVTLAHPDLGVERFHLPQDGHRLIEFVAPLWPDERPAAAEVVRAPEATGMPDNGIASVAILSEASLAAVSEAAGQDLDIARFRGNLILDGETPWAEFDWVGRRLSVGGAVVEVIEPIGRCRATEADPATGVRNVDILGLLRDRFGHTNFGVYARVVEGGAIAPGDSARLI